MRTVLFALLVSCFFGLSSANAADNFKDVPKDHWAADSVQIVKADGVIKGYPDATFKGDKPVTRYELAVALERMIAFIEQGLKPEIKAQGPESRAESPEPAQFLKSAGYLPANSPLLTDQKKTVSPTELAQALASVTAHIVEKNIPPQK